MLGSERLTGALLDRLMHHVSILTMNGDSYRLRQSTSRQPATTTGAKQNQANDESIDPEVALRLMLAGFLVGIVHDRRLMREAQVNIAIRWFAGFGLADVLPDHSSLTRIRQRWGADRFRAMFVRTVQACMAAGIARGEVVHIDATLIRADVSWESLGVRHADAAMAQDGGDASNVSGSTADPAKARAERNGKQSGRHKKVYLTDLEATMATNARNRRLKPAYKQHTAVDDVRGIILDVEVIACELWY